ncbi:hypothetical protein TOPH_05602 [Tolypocladium ophioglossoides CBS 100239]|uniref:Uncharacterized protein n=1 Tax=Tolypocladium ophioglossoides (strain CBS 100239) TaxID=1163406 RepID=A0A0L0N6G8_TOLOC|nr:hypothetical protein TOPH_05602 [Tolypocladium ophioglossoides CBS 100239]
MNNQNDDESYGFFKANPPQDGSLAWPGFAYGQPSSDVFAPHLLMEQRPGEPKVEFLGDQGMPLFALGPWSNNSASGQEPFEPPLRLFGQSTTTENTCNLPMTNVQTGRQPSHDFDQTQYYPMNDAGCANQLQRQPRPQSYAYLAGAELQEATPRQGPGHGRRPTVDAEDGVSNAGNQSVEKKIRSFCNSKTYRYLKPRADAHQLSPGAADLIEAYNKSPTRQFPGLFASAAAANEALENFQNLYRKPLKECTTPIEDQTFPSTDEETVAVVKQVFEAIVDWSYILEWKSALSREAKSQVAKMLSTKGGGQKSAKPDLDGLRPSPEELEKLLPPIDVQQKLILGQVPRDQTIEWVSWGIVQAAFQSQQGITQLSCWCEADGG